MTRALVIQMLDCLVKLSEQSDCDIDPFTFGRYGGNSAVTAAREYLATEPSGERAELIAQLRDAHGRRFDTSPPPYSRAADMLEADADLRTQLARRTVERNMAISMLEADAQQAKRVPMSEKQIDKIHADTARLAQIRTTFFIAFARAIEAHHGITNNINK